jgi:DNA polymerase kappa
MAGFVAAKLCPHLIFVPNVFSRYAEMSKKVMDIFKRYDTTMAVAGCDEGYLKLAQYLLSLSHCVLTSMSI